jgi:hypothetical protein
LAIELENQESLAIELLKLFTVGHLVVLEGGLLTSLPHDNGAHMSALLPFLSLSSPVLVLGWEFCAGRRRCPTAADATGPPCSLVELASTDRLQPERILTPSSMAAAQAEVGPSAVAAARLDLAPAGHGWSLNGSSPIDRQPWLRPARRNNGGEVGAHHRSIDGGKAGGVHTAWPLDLRHGGAQAGAGDARVCC